MNNSKGEKSARGGWGGRVNGNVPDIGTVNCVELQFIIKFSFDKIKASSFPLEYE
jgi:hypothetical protein